MDSAFAGFLYVQGSMISWWYVDLLPRRKWI